MYSGLAKQRQILVSTECSTMQVLVNTKLLADTVDVWFSRGAMTLLTVLEVGGEQNVREGCGPNVDQVPELRLIMMPVGHNNTTNSCPATTYPLSSRPNGEHQTSWHGHPMWCRYASAVSVHRHSESLHRFLPLRFLPHQLDHELLTHRVTSFAPVLTVSSVAVVRVLLSFP